MPICGDTKCICTAGQPEQWLQCQLDAGHYSADTIYDDDGYMIDYRINDPHQYTQIDGDPSKQEQGS